MIPMGDQLSNSVLPTAGFGHHSHIRMELRDGVTGELKALRELHNMKVYGTFNMLISGVTNSAGTASACYGALGSGPDVASADTTLSGEMSTTAFGRTVGRLSHDANGPNWNLSFSWSAAGTSTSIGQIGIFTTVSVSGGVLYLKATYARLTLNSQDILNVAWLQSFASA